MRSDPRAVGLYHITHVENLGGIVDTGLMCDRLARGEPLRVEIGQPEVKERRRSRQIRVGPRGFVPDYVPFYFAPRSPMLYKIATRGFPEYVEGEDPVLHLVTDIGMLVDLGLDFVFSDGNCASAITEQFADLAHLDRIDWAIMEERYWRDTDEDGDRMRRRMAEFLVHESVPWEAIHELVAKSEETAAKARAILGQRGSSTPVSVSPEWYYYG